MIPEAPAVNPLRTVNSTGTIDGMTTHTPAQGLDRLDALITPDLYAYVDGMNRAAVIGWGTTLNTVDLIRGIRTLHAAGKCHAAMPLLRSVIEYTLGTIWLADAGDDAADIFNIRLKRSHTKLNKALEDKDLDAVFSADAMRTFRDVLNTDLDPHPDERLIAFAHLLEEYGFKEMIPVYNVLSGITHLSSEGAQEFFWEITEGTVLSLNPRHAEPVPCEVICLGMQFDAMNAYNELLTGKPWTAELIRISGDHKIPRQHYTRNPPKTT